MCSVRLLTLCAVTALLALAQDSAGPSVGVYMDFDSTPGTPSVEAMKKEVESLLKPSGISLEWRFTRENRGDEAFAGLVVLRFKGTCKAEPWLPSAVAFGSLGESRPLASTEVAGGKVLPYSEVECDLVRGALSHLPPGADRNQRQTVLGRAMGRVVAHEIYHILARTTAHAVRGLAKASESFEDLVSSDTLSFLDQESAAMRTALTAHQ